MGLSRIVYIIAAFPDNAFQKDQTVSGFLNDKFTTTPVQGTSEISTVKECGHT